jgi:ABC-type Fe3+/spermidine/putrescine transport system ATPase subunit
MLELKNIHKSLTMAGHTRPLAKAVDLRIEAGQVVAILGASGSGKSTLLNIIAGLEPPDAGQVLFNGVDLAGTPAHQRRFALMFQDFALFPHLNVQDNVAFGLVEQGMPRSQARARARDMLTIFSLAAQATQKVWTLSGGEQQRTALARALIPPPRTPPLDEPFSALVVTHDEDEARAMAVRGYRLAQGLLHPLW